MKQQTRLLVQPSGRALYTRWKVLFVSVIALLLLAVQVAPSFQLYFMEDDFSWYRFASEARTLGEIMLKPSPGGWTTPLANAGFWLAFRVGDDNPAVYFGFIVLLHLTNTLLVALLIWKVNCDRWVALAGSAVFMLHFSHFSDWGTLVWIAAFVQVLVATFYLLALLLFLQFCADGDKKKGVLSILAFMAALATKESAVSLPLLVGAWLYIDRSNLLYPTRRTAVLSIYGAILAVWAVYLVYELSFQANQHYFGQKIYGIGPHLLWNWKYLANLVSPNPGSLPVQSFMARTFSPAVITVVTFAHASLQAITVGTLLILWLRGSRIVRIWVATIVVAYLPFTGFIPGYAGPNRYFYLPLVGFAALVGMALVNAHRWIRQRWPQVATPLTFALCFSLWLAALIPGRVWQWQMLENSEVRRAVVDAVERAQLSGGSPVHVYLTSFPSKFDDLPRVLDLLYGIPATKTDDLTEDVVLAGNLWLEYLDGEVYGRSQVSP